MSDSGVVDQDIDARSVAVGIDACESGLHRRRDCDIALERGGCASSPRILSTASVADLRSQSRANTRAPFCANVEAIAKPIPDPAPVTIAIFPSSRNIEAPRCGQH